MPPWLFLAIFNGNAFWMRTIKIAFTGPESSGKTTLAHWIADKHKGLYVEEYAREYLENKVTYNQSDLTEIAKKQVENWNATTSFLVADTEMTVICIWSIYKYGTIDAEILRLFDQQTFDILFLCKPDIPWEFDPLRENPENREELFDLYHSFLLEKKQNFVVVEGNEAQRKQIIESSFQDLNLVK